MTTALITGASAGLGAAYARELAATGHDLVLVARSEDRLRQLAQELRAAHGIRTEVLVADLADRDDLEQVAQRIRGDGECGEVDLLVNNAGFGLNSAFLESEIAAEENLLDVLCRAVLVLSHAAGNAMKARGRGGILNVASVAGFVAVGTYSAAKAWVTVFTESLAAELGSYGVAVSAVCPGFTHTEFHERAQMNMSALPQWLWLDAQDVVRTSLQDLRRFRPISVPGAAYRVLVAAIGLPPRTLMAQASSALARRRRLA
ncbi:SDR family NAD(P)-dependent oxidoreductase [Gephyromycinifex aptenodytis]|uniref:SDR family NAD(P)-dependent oxidoreductase n=1 Tax=Gephyromycinifex aptenodytis TaxID=2716227 RepID=UPI0014458E7A|nr:SDR family oxidoreductase [Gephyromycinifex aptenodytis]